MQVLGVGDHDAALLAEHDLFGLEGDQAREALLVDGPVASSLATASRSGWSEGGSEPTKWNGRASEQLVVVL